MSASEKSGTGSWKRFFIIPSLRLKLTLLLSTTAAIYGVIAGSNEPIVSFLRDTRLEDAAIRLHIGNEIVFGISVGYLTGVFVWFLLVWIPDNRKREIIRTNLRRKYRDFKHANMQTLIHASGSSANLDTIDSLCADHKKFKDLFDANDKALWYAAMNGIADETKPFLDDILVEYQILADELNYASNNLLIQDEELHSFIRRMLEIVHRLSNYNSDRYSLEKLIGNYLYEIFGRFSVVSGQLEIDFVEEMIDRI